MSGENHMKDEKARLICNIKIKKNKYAILMEVILGSVLRDGATVAIRVNTARPRRGAVLGL